MNKCPKCGEYLYILDDTSYMNLFCPICEILCDMEDNITYIVREIRQYPESTQKNIWEKYKNSYRYNSEW
jgi:uncharacterized Zn finger protein (UPF0148 family)